MSARRLSALVLSCAAACAPRATTLTGVAVAPQRIPVAQLAPGAQQLTFTWEYRDSELFASGEGAARITAPDSARLDLFMRGGMGNGFAVVLGDTIHAPGGGLLSRLIPPAAMFWAAVGRLAVPPGDTTVRIDGGVMHADIRHGATTMRVAFNGERLASIETIRDDGVIERATRTGAELRYEHFTAHRVLLLTVTRTQAVEPFDASIWKH